MTIKYKIPRKKEKNCSMVQLYNGEPSYYNILLISGKKRVAFLLSILEYNSGTIQAGLFDDIKFDKNSMS